MYKTVKTQTNLPVKICHLKVPNLSESKKQMEIVYNYRTLSSNKSTLLGPDIKSTRVSAVLIRITKKVKNNVR